MAGIEIGGIGHAIPTPVWRDGIEAAALTPVQAGQALAAARGSVFAFAPNFDPGTGPLASASTGAPRLPSLGDMLPQTPLDLLRFGGRAVAAIALLTPTNASRSTIDLVGQPDVRIVSRPGELTHWLEARIDGQWQRASSLEYQSGGFRIVDPEGSARRIGHPVGTDIVIASVGDGPLIGVAITTQNDDERRLASEGIARGDSAQQIQQTIDLDRIDRRNLPAATIRDLGPPPPGMERPHRHHILSLNGRTGDERALVREGQQILREVGIDPERGIENLVWASNRGHTIAETRNLVEQLREAAGSRTDVLLVLNTFSATARLR